MVRKTPWLECEAAGQIASSQEAEIEADAIAQVPVSDFLQSGTPAHRDRAIYSQGVSPISPNPVQKLPPRHAQRFGF